MTEIAPGIPAWLSPEQMRNDIDQLALLYERVHPRPLAGFPVQNPAGGLSRLKAQLSAPRSRMDFYRSLAPVFNASGDEHTHLMLPAEEIRAYARQGGLFFPRGVGIIDGRVYIGPDPEEQAAGIPPGAELLEINSRPIPEILEVVKGFFSGTSTRQREHFAEVSFPEAIWLAYGPAGEFAVTYRARGEPAACEAVLPGRPISEIEHETEFPVLNETPLRFRSDNSFRRVGDQALVFQFRAFENRKDSLTKMIAELIATAQKEAFTTLIVDLRENIGGSSFLAGQLFSWLISEPFLLLESSDLHVSEELKQHFLGFIPPFLRAIGIQYIHPWTRKLFQAPPGSEVPIVFKPTRPRAKQKSAFAGKVIFLSGPGDYSSSAILLGAVKHYRAGLIAGEPSGGYPTHYGNCTRHTLAASRLEALIPASTNHGKGSGPVVPDYEIRRSPEDIAAGRDPVLEFALRLAAPAGLEGSN